MKKIVVLAGGLSPERDVSLTSGSRIANSLIKSGYEVMLLDLYLGINNKDIKPEYKNSSSKELFDYSVPTKEPDLEKLKKESNNGNKLIGEGVLDICMNADVVFMALHGSIGENGKLQAVFDTFGINYTGTGYEGSLLAMDKDLSKRMMKQDNILTADWQTLSLNEPYNIEEIKTPCVIKPFSCGSSAGISIVNNKDELEKALEYAKVYEDNVIIEEKIEGREFSIGIFAGKPLPIIEIIPKEGFYDYKNKYQAGATEEICPANLDEKTRDYLWDCALKVHKTLRLGHYSRIDFILDKKGNAYCLEANTLPGMTPTSLMPQEAQAAGIPYDTLCEEIAKSGIVRKRK